MSIGSRSFVLMVAVSAAVASAAPQDADFGPFAAATRGKTCCPTGWIAYASSCYWFARHLADRRTFLAARAACKGIGASLMTPETKAEWDAVMRHAVNTQPTWIGLSVNELDRAGPQWDGQAGEREYTPISPLTLPWLNKTPMRGAAQGSECAAYYNAVGVTGSYTNFYGCYLVHYYVCKRPA